MLRYKLSRIFTAKAERFVPGDSFFNKSAKQIMDSNRNHYRDRLIESLQTLLEKFQTGLVMTSKTTGTGQATFKLTAPITYPNGTPIEIQLSTECSDLLLMMGREAAFRIECNGEKKVFYYGDSYSPDNSSQFLQMPNYVGDVREIAVHLHSKTFSGLYAEYMTAPLNNASGRKHRDGLIIR